MKKNHYVLRTLLIALWPIIFLLIIGTIEHRFRILVGQSFRPSYYGLLIIIYICAGLLFSFNSFFEKDFIKRKSAVGAYIVSGVSVVLFFVLWLLTLTNFVFIRSLFNMFSRMPLNICSLVFGYTVYSTIKAIVCHNIAVKQKNI